MKILTSNNSDYHADREHLSSSGLKLLLKDPHQFYLEYVLGQRVDVEADKFTEGSAVHTLILEPHLFEQEYAIFPGMRRAGREWEAFKEANVGKKLLSQAQLGRCEKLVQAALAMPVAVKMLEGTLPEHTLVSEINGVKVKCRADAINPAKYIIDVKTTSMPSDPELFRHTVAEFGYDLSAALYERIAFDNYGVNLDYYWIVLSKTDGQCHVYKASEETLVRGSGLVTKALVQYKKCLASGVWASDTVATPFDTKNYEIKEI